MSELTPEQHEVAIELARLAATDEHPSAEDYRNRAERAEQEAAELRADVVRLKRVIDELSEELVTYALHMIR